MAAAASVDVGALGSSVEAAAARIEGHVHRTPLELSHYFSERTGCGVHMKWESEQVTGSFKARGAANKVLLLAEGGHAAFDGGLTSISTGNHALAFTHALQSGVASGAVPAGVDATVFVPEGAARSKLENLRLHHAPLSVYPGGYDDAEAHARALAQDSGGVFISACKQQLDFCPMASI
jgi:threonine dehydratase